MAYYSGLVCIAPYMNVYYKRLHISERQIGVLAALSPWVNASSGIMLRPTLPVFCKMPSVIQHCSDAGWLVALQALHGLPLLTIPVGTSPF